MRDSSPETGVREGPVPNLYRKIRMTYSSRFNASRRLWLHQRLSLWTISIISVTLILMPLLLAFNVPLRVSGDTVNLLQVISAVLILTISVIVNMSGFSDRAEKLHLCGIELNRLGKELYLLIDSDAGGAEAYEDALGRYDDILRRYETHANIDYHLAKAQKQPRFYGVMTAARFFIYARFYAQYAHYVALTLLEFYCVYRVVDWSKL